MKKVLVGIVVLAVLLLASVYLFIPSKLNVIAVTNMHAALPAVSRVLFDDNNWKKFWPGPTPLMLNDQAYSIKGKFINVFTVDIISNGIPVNSNINLLSLNADSVTVTWNAEYRCSSNPVRRYIQYRKAASTKKNMNAILKRMKEFMEKTENIYGFEIRNTTVVDSVLISTRRKFDHRPTTYEIDEMIQSLKKYIAANNAIEKNFPMLNVFRNSESNFEAMTAIPVDKELPLTKDFAPKFLLKGGNILESEIKGGPHTIETALKELENYRVDFGFASPAIPYQLLITDRTKEPDTAKWITRLYFPVN